LEIEEHEPFNTKLFEKAKDLARQEEDLIEEIAALRRKVPGVVVEGVKREYKEGVEGDDEALRRVEERHASREKGDVIGISTLERQNNVEESWQRGVKGLEGLKRSMPGMVARKEEAEEAEKYVVTEGGR
jgi:kinetochor protein Mis14/NSL1